MKFHVYGMENASLSLTVETVSAETPKISVFVLRSGDGDVLPGYAAGAHINIDLGKVGSRSYSLVDWPDRTDPTRYVIAAQREDDGTGGSRAMHDLRAGDVIVTSAPSNDFTLRDGDAPVLLLAGGIGVTPLISMAAALSEQGRRFAFHYAGRSRATMGFLDALTSAFPSQLILHFDDTDPLDLTALISAQPARTKLYVCGPKGMIDAARAAAIASGISEGDIHVELFSSPDAQDGDRSFEVEIESTGAVFTIPAGQSIIEVLEEAGLDVMYDCQRGDCGICQTDVIRGEPDHRDVVLSEAEKASGKVMQICVSRAKSARLVLDL